MKRQRNLRWAYLFIAAIICLMAITPVVRADGPVRVQVDKQDGTDEVEQPVFQPAPAVNSEESRTVGSPEAAPQTGVKGLWAKVRAVGGKFLDGALKWATGSDSQAWSDPKRIWGATKKFGYNLLNGTVELLTGANIDKWKGIGKWGWKDWLVVGVNIALTLIPVGKIASAGLRVASKVGGPLVARVAGKLIGKGSGRLLAKMGAGMARGLRKVPGVRWVKDAWTAGRSVSRRSKAVQAIAGYVSSGFKKVKVWQKAKGIRSLPAYTKLDTRNPLIKTAIDKVAPLKAIVNWPKQALVNSRLYKRASSTRLGTWMGKHVAPILSKANIQGWQVRDMVVSRNPVSTLLKIVEGWTEVAISRNRVLVIKGEDALIRQTAWAKRLFWFGTRDLIQSARNRYAVKSLSKFAAGTIQKVHGWFGRSQGKSGAQRGGSGPV